MPSDIDFWLALTSPASYLASLRIDAVAERHGRKVRWRPFNIREALEAEGVKPNVMYPRKGAYARHDWARTARLHGHPFRMPDPFGRSSLPAMAIAYAAGAEAGQDALKSVCRIVMAAYFADMPPSTTPTPCWVSWPGRASTPKPRGARWTTPTWPTPSPPRPGPRWQRASGAPP